MASKAAIEKADQQPGAFANVSQGAAGAWGNITRFLSDVRAEMRKVVTPTRKEVQATTTVVIITVFVFGAFFFVVDLIFNRALHEILTRLGGTR